jgi:predicted RNA-binding Zn ribbon-like protein
VLDFVATVAERGTTDEEKLRTGADLAAWVQQSGIIDDPIAVTPQQLDHAKAVREALFGLISALIDDARPKPPDRALVNDTARLPGPILTLTKAGTIERHGDLPGVLAALARDCLALHDSPDARALRWCADARCTRPFVDRSRGRRRRWCGMKSCGDRAKAASYRQRHRQQAAHPGAARPS